MAAFVQPATAAAPQLSNVSSHPFTCNTCQVAFRSSDLQRTHMQSDWHENSYTNHLGSQKHKIQAAKRQFNLAAGDDVETSSVMSSTFSLGEPIDTASSHDGVDDAETRSEVSAVTDGLQQANLDDQEAPLSETPTNTTQTAATDDAGEVPLNQCLFCNFASGDVSQNVTHMSKHHGMFIPEQEYLVDLEGLLGYLHEKIYDIHECLYCGQMKHTTSGIQTHMRDRGHCMIAYSSEEEMLEIGEFYDFRSTYSDEEEEDDDESTDGAEDHQDGGVKLGASRAAKVTIQNETGEDVETADEDDEGWESDSTLSSVPTDEITAVPIDDHSHRYKNLDQHRHHSHKDPRPHKNTDGFHSHAHSTPHAVYHDDYELHLPTGRTAGHRSLAKYFRQNLRNYPTPAEQAERRTIEGRHDSDAEEEEQRRPQRDRARQVMSRADGGLGMVGVTDAKKREIKAVEKRTQKREQRAQARYQWGNDKRGNSQKHFRDPLLQ
ncbi:pre-60S factor rei1 [Taxawa tesnikishii (nom. ined.)]|nr:pre-60S factor rei1 [Dothideales sp. JES 119]